MTRWIASVALFCAVGLTAMADGGFVSREARAIAEPTQKALIVHQKGIEDLILQVRYQGASEDFAWIVPTPSQPRVGRCSPRIFSELYRLAQARDRQPSGGFGGGGVQVLERKQVGVYDTAVLEARNPQALLIWLRKNGYHVSRRVTPLLADYTRRGWFFTVMRIDPRRARAKEMVTNGELKPIRLTFASTAPVYPLKISSMNGGVTDLMLFLITEGPVSKSGLRVRYQRRIQAESLNRVTQGMPRIDRPMWLTYLSRRMPASAMTRDLEFFVRIPVGVR